MLPYSTVAIPETLAAAARATRRSPQYGHPAHAELATGYGPCRSCLQTFDEGRDERLLFTYNPFADLDREPLPGPIFIHLNECARYADAGFPPELERLPLTLEAYGADRELRARERIHGGSVDPLARRLLSDPDVQYVHVRNTEAGCYIARLERRHNA